MQQTLEFVLHRSGHSVPPLGGIAKVANEVRTIVAIAAAISNGFLNSFIHLKFFVKKNIYTIKVYLLSAKKWHH
jgi:hypothetical protein